jgi:hypothetical protein
MALKGSLSDIGVVDLVQFAHSGRKSGQLVLASSAETARLFYDHGQLVHATLGALEGLQVLVEIFGWTEAEFSFSEGVQCPTRSIHLDLPRAVMAALKMRDDHLAASRDSQSARSAADPEAVQLALAAAVARFVAGTPNTQYACVFDAKGETLAESGAISGALEELERIKTTVRDLAARHPRAGFERLFLADASGTLAATTIPSGWLAMTIASVRAPLGAVSVAIAKLAAAVGPLGREAPTGTGSP